VRKIFGRKHIIIRIIMILLSILIFNVSLSIATVANTVNNHQTVRSNNNQLRSFLVVLKPHQAAKLRHLVMSLYSTTLNRRQFAMRYGQSGKYIRQLKHYFNRYHLKVMPYQGNLVIKVLGSKRNIEKALHFRLIQIRNKNTTIYKPNHLLRIKSNLQKNIQGFLLSNIGGALHSLESTIDQYKGRSPQTFINRYNVKDLDTVNNIRRSSVGILSFGNFNSGDVKTFWQRMKINDDDNNIHIYKNNDYQRLINNSETTIDIEQASAINPQAQINLYLSSPTIFGMVDNLAKAISDNKSDSLSLSWGISEAEITQLMYLGVIPHNYNQMLNTILLQGAAQGISVFDASGDNGAYDGISNGFTNLSVETPASSPYVTAVGATTLPVKYKMGSHWIIVKHERAWSNDFLYPLFNKLKLYNSHQKDFLNTYFMGSGGGFSKFNITPQYQQGISGIGTYNAIKYWHMKHQLIKQYVSPKRNTGSMKGRNLPDIVADGDPQTGYAIYFNHQWMMDGGTSIVAPQIASVATLFVAKSNHRMGLWNPKLYSIARTFNSPFTPINNVNQNSNLYFTGQPHHIYNQATGLGTVDFNKLFQDMRTYNH
jgi:kumamolisin